MGICIFGQGDCGAKSEAIINEQNEILNRTITEVFQKQLQKHQALGHVVQRIIARSKLGDVTVRDVNLENYVAISLDSWQNMQNQTDINQMFNTVAQNVVDSQLKAVSGFLSPSAESTFRGELVNTITNELVNVIKVEQVGECMANVYVEQVVKAETEEGSALVEAINMKNTSEIVASCISEQISDVLQKSAVLSKVINDVNVELDSVSKGPLDFIVDMFSSFLGLFSGIGGIIFIIILVVGFIIFMIVIYYLFFGRARRGRGGRGIPKISRF